MPITITKKQIWPEVSAVAVHHCGTRNVSNFLLGAFAMFKV